MTAFVPPYPERPPAPLPPIAALKMARRNFLGVFDDKCFEYQFFSTRMLNRRAVHLQQPGYCRAGLYRACTTASSARRRRCGTR